MGKLEEIGDQRHGNFLAKAFFVLDIIAKGGGYTLVELETKTHLKKTTLFRIVQQLVDLGYVEKEKRVYRPGMRLFSLVPVGTNSRTDIRKISLPFLQRLRDMYNETVNLANWDGSDCILLDSLSSTQVLRTENPVGTTFPLHATAIGKVIAAFLPPETIAALINRQGLAPKTPRTLTDPDQFRHALDAIRERGFAEDNQESIEGVYCAAGPIFESSGAVRVALSMSLPVLRLGPTIKAELVRDVLTFCRRISFELGYSYETRIGK